MPVSPKSLANLRPVSKGERVPNAGKKPGMLSLITALKNHYRQHPEDLDKIITKLNTEASKGNLKAIDLIFNRLDGAVKQQIEIATIEPIIIETDNKTIEITPNDNKTT